MPNIRLTKRVIETLAFPTSGQVLYRDDDLPGLGFLGTGREYTRDEFIFVVDARGEAAHRADEALCPPPTMLA